MPETNNPNKITFKNEGQEIVAYEGDTLIGCFNELPDYFRIGGEYEFTFMDENIRNPELLIEIGNKWLDIEAKDLEARKE